MLSLKHLLLVCASLALTVKAFAPTTRSSLTKTRLAMMAPQTPPPAVETVTTVTIMQDMSTTTSPVLQQGVQSYLGSSSSSMQVALQERKIPTKEEIEAKKRNFNVIFWGGGFVAPFLATVFYFGFKFWEK